MKKIERIKKKIMPILRRHSVRKAAIFGSFARGEEKKTSDIDILVEIKKDISLLDFIGIQQEIEDVLHRKVDLIEYDTLKPIIKERALLNYLLEIRTRRKNPEKVKSRRIPELLPASLIPLHRQ